MACENSTIDPKLNGEQKSNFGILHFVWTIEIIIVDTSWHVIIISSNNQFNSIDVS
jgi:hypothetical protein